MPTRIKHFVAPAIDLRRLGETIAARRKSLGMTQTDLAEAAGQHQGEISKLERGLVEPTLQSLANIAVALRLHPLRLLGVVFDE